MEYQLLHVRHKTGRASVQQQKLVSLTVQYGMRHLFITTSHMHTWSWCRSLPIFSFLFHISQFNKKAIAIANRSRISRSFHKIFDQGWGRSRPCKNFPPTCFDHAKFGLSAWYRVGVHVGLKNLGGPGVQPPCDRGVADPWIHAPPMCHHALWTDVLHADVQCNN